MAYQSDVQRITRALNWIGAGALGFGIIVVVWALWWTRGVDDFRTAVIVAALGFGLPSLVALTLAWLLDPLLDSERATAPEAPPPDAEKPARLRFGFYDWPAAFRYFAAIVAVGLSALLRIWLHPVLGDSVPYITFFLGVALAAWVGGFGPSALAVAISIVIAWRWTLQGASDLPPYQLAHVVSVGVFAATALAIGVITSAMRATAAEAERLSAVTQVRNAELQSIEVELRHERDRIKVTLEAIDEAVITTDTDGLITFLNPSAERLTGWRLRDARGVPLMKVMELVDEKTSRRAPLPMSRSMDDVRAGHPPSILLVDRKGKRYPIEDSAAPIVSTGGEPIGHVVVFRDVTRARHAQAALQESEARFRATADSAPVLIWMSDSTKACDYFNRQWLEFTGRTMEQELGDGWAEGVHSEDFQRCLAVYAAAFDSRQPFTMEYRLRRFDGEHRWVVDHGVPRFAPDGTFVGYIGACMDITDQKKARMLSTLPT
ncbi:MAG TPA: PAS domain S-box protein [Casimicrobiaceae bacterium]|jgi:PAS domain S-box-containing protein